jgi:hypothetical protein
VGEEPQSYDGDKIWSSISHSILSGKYSMCYCALDRKEKSIFLFLSLKMVFRKRMLLKITDVRFYTRVKIVLLQFSKQLNVVL